MCGLKKIYRLPIGIWKDAQHCSLVEKGKSTLQGGTTSYQSEWPSLDSWWITDAERVWRRGKPSYTVGGVETGAATVENIMEVPQKTKNRISTWSNNSNPEHIFGKKTIPWKDSCTPMFIAAQLIIPKTWKQPKCPSTDEWVKKMLYVPTHTHNGILLRHFKNEIMPFAAAWMDLEINILSEEDRKRKTIFRWYHPYVKSKRNISMKQEQTQRQRIGLWLPRREGLGAWD